MDKNKSVESRETIRINKYLSSAGVCSRREADRMIEEGRVSVNGRTVLTGEQVDPSAEICVDGKPVGKKTEKVLLLFYKPRGIVCSTKKQRQEITVQSIWSTLCASTLWEGLTANRKAFFL